MILSPVAGWTKTSDPTRVDAGWGGRSKRLQLGNKVRIPFVCPWEPVLRAEMHTLENEPTEPRDQQASGAVTQKPEEMAGQELMGGARAAGRRGRGCTGSGVGLVPRGDLLSTGKEERVLEEPLRDIQFGYAHNSHYPVRLQNTGRLGLPVVPQVLLPAATWQGL